MKVNTYSRRKFINRAIKHCVPFLGGWVLHACGPKKTAQQNQNQAASADPCEDLSGISESEIRKREQFGYVKKSPIPDNQCNNCNLWLPSKTDKACGGCMLFQGPVYAEGYCTYWAPKV